MTIGSHDVLGAHANYWVSQKPTQQQAALFCIAPATLTASPAL